MMTGAQALALAQGYIGCDRSKFRSKYKAMTGVDFGASADWCCGFASCIVVGWGGAKLAGLPSLWCPDARRDATSAGREVSLEQAKAGDVVYFEFSGNENADHVGIFESYKNGVLTTVDGNVSNRVGRRSRVKGRDYRKVWVVRPEYAAEQAKSEAAEHEKKAQEQAEIAKLKSTIRRNNGMEMLFYIKGERGTRYLSGSFQRMLGSPEELTAIEDAYRMAYDMEIPHVVLNADKGKALLKALGTK